MQRFDSPERAGIAEFPPEHCRVVRCETSGDDAYVLLDAGPPTAAYLYGANCRRDGGGWFETASGNGSNWAPCDEDGELGTLALWDSAPSGAEAVRAEFNGEMVEDSVRNGAYLFVWWRVPCPDPLEWPRVNAVRTTEGWRKL